MRDLYHNILVSQHLNPVTATSTKTSTSIDLQGFSSAEVVFSIGQSGDTLSGSVFWTLSLQESNDNSTFTAVGASSINTGIATAVLNTTSSDKQTYTFGYIGNSRYLQAVATASGTMTSGTPMAIIGLRGTAAYRPVV